MDDAEIEYLAALNALTILEVNLNGLSRDRVMDLYHDMVTADEDPDYVYEYGEGDDGFTEAMGFLDVSNESSPMISAAASSTVRAPTLALPTASALSDASAEPEGDSFALEEDPARRDNYDAKIANVSSVLCCPTGDALHLLQRHGWDEVAAISAFLECGGVLIEEDVGPPPQVSHGYPQHPSPFDHSPGGGFDFADDFMVRAPDTAKTDKLIIGRGGAVDSIMMRKMVVDQLNKDREEPGVEWLYSLPEGYPNSAELFTNARDLARTTNKWLLVNIQSDKEFSCHLMNRDTWSDGTLEAVIESGYIFWQRGVKSPAGVAFLSLYNICTDPEAQSSLFPGIFFIDPRSGALVKSITGTGLIPATELVSILFEFTEAHPTDSWGESLAPPIAPWISQKESDSKAPEMDAVAHSIPPPQPEVLRVVSYGEVSSEPSESEPDICKISIKFKSGKSQARRFLLTDPVRAVYAFVATVEDGPFDLRQVTAPTRLSDYLDSSIREVSIAGSKLVVCNAE